MEGYWNGCVWMPHQLLLWKSMLDMGLPERARQIAFTALETWKKETALTYLSFEHFIIASGRGAGWHNFSGLSSPMINWYYSYFKPGTVSTGFDTICVNQVFGVDASSFRTQLLFDKDSYGNATSILVCMDPEKEYRVTLDGRPIAYSSPFKGLLEITIQSRAGYHTLEIK
jgi:hypothetical protein